MFGGVDTNESYISEAFEHTPPTADARCDISFWASAFCTLHLDIFIIRISRCHSILDPFLFLFRLTAVKTQLITIY